MVVEDGRGEGILVTQDGRFTVTYGLTVRDLGRGKIGDGQLIGEEQALYAAFTEDSVRLELKDGRVAPIIITRYGAGTGLAEFKLAGAIVGP